MAYFIHDKRPINLLDYGYPRIHQTNQSAGLLYPTIRVTQSMDSSVNLTCWIILYMDSSVKSICWIILCIHGFISQIYLLDYFTIYGFISQINLFDYCIVSMDLSNQSAEIFYPWIHQSNQSIIKHKQSEESLQAIFQQ
jgi:hypothetical protein